MGFELVNDLSHVSGQSDQGHVECTSCNCFGVYPSPPIVPMPPAFDTAAANGPPDVRAMPASMMGYLIPSSLVSGVLRAGGDDIFKDGCMFTSREVDKPEEQMRNNRPEMKEF